ncbi:hypothetical protein [Pararhodobacter zhoushanensis]|jgi:hypothetical protein|uniref:Uncharacterized protein n=1 Tax=Pararhodobacter zhoushanensis TaxID=2479545 RepID=A0ABT3H4B2_9RHOB|nr:hypothetical protein [Pararhodobacter zhoushanensis]MCW1934614.1 hypothetical protein [Pararhodobacter zhoushanensis]
MTKQTDTDPLHPAPPADAARKVQSVKGTKGDPTKEARVKAALKANIARRKAQSRARNEGETDV